MTEEFILVVEDDAIIAMRLQDTLEAWGYRTEYARSAPDAIACAVQMHPDLVLMDINLDGEMDGIQAAQAMRRMNLPTIFLTAYADDELLEQAKTAEPYGYLVKPVYDRELRSTIEMSLSKHRSEQKLRESERRFRAIFQQAGVGVALANANSDELVAANAKFWQIVGVPPESLGLDWKDHTHPEDVVRQQGYLERMRQGKISEFTMEKRYLRRDGTTVWVNITASAMWEPGEAPTQHVFVVEDITARKLADQALQQHLAELEAVNRISSALRSAEHVSQALPLLLNEMVGILDARVGAIALYHSNSLAVDYLEARGWMQEITSLFDPQTGLAEQGMQLKKPVLITDLAAGLRVVDVSGTQVPPGWSAMVAPIRAMDEVMGLALVSAPAARQFQPEDLRLLETLVDIAGSAIHRMRLFEQTTRSLNRIAALHEIDNAIRSNLSMSSTLSVILDRVIQQLGVDAADVLLYDEAAGGLTLAALMGFEMSPEEAGVIPMGVGLAGKAAAERLILVGGVENFTQEPGCWAELLLREGFHQSITVPLVSKDRVSGVLEVFLRTDCALDDDQVAFLGVLAGQTSVAVEGLRLIDSLKHSNDELAEAYHETIEGWSRAMDLRDKETEGHTLRVTELTLELARRLNYSDADMVQIRRGALLHDIGKIGVPDGILLKPGALTPEEWVVMRSHPVLAYELLSPIAYLRPALDIPYGHHERWDGSGYPQGLAGEQIPLAARMFAVVDVFDALTSDRPYRAAWSKEKAAGYLRENAGSQFDPKIVVEFLDLIMGASGYPHSG